MSGLESYDSEISWCRANVKKYVDYNIVQYLSGNSNFKKMKQTPNYILSKILSKFKLFSDNQKIFFRILKLGWKIISPQRTIKYRIK